MEATTNQEQLGQDLFAFPQITYEEFLQLDDLWREEIVKRNRILQTDTYNRTMCHAKQERWKDEETYVNQMRRAPGGYLIATGTRRHIQKALGILPLTQWEFDFARDFYRDHANVPFFNEEMWQSVLDNDGYFPLDIDAVPDGTAVLASDPVMRINGVGELGAHIEPSVHRIFYDSLVATTAHEIATKLGADRFIEVGKRGTPNEEMHLQAAVAMYVGGGISMTSNDAAVAAYPDKLRDVGTLGHRFIQFYDTPIESFRQAIETTPQTSLLIDLTGSMQGIGEALQLKQEYRDTGKKIWIRLDSGNILEQTIHTLREYQRLGFTDPALDKIVVEDISSVDEMVQMDEAIRAAGFDPDKFVVYGAGGLLVTKMKERSVASTGYKLAEVLGAARLKPAPDSPGKESLPGKPTLVQTAEGRVIAQVGEVMGEDLFEPVARNGRIVGKDNTDAARAQVERTFPQIEEMVGQKTPLSPKTKQLVHEVKAHYGLATA